MTATNPRRTPTLAPLVLEAASSSTPSLSVIEPSPATAMASDYEEEMPMYTVRWLRPHYATTLLDLPTAPVVQSHKEHWHAFAEEESDDLECEWWTLPEDERLNSGPLAAEDSVPEDLEEDEEDVVGVSIYKDKLFEVDVRKMELKPVYWRRQTTHPVPVMRAHWMFDTTHPVLEPLNSLLEEMYREARPWTAAYADALDAALDIGPEAYHKFKYEIPDDPQKRSVFFQDGDSARLVSDQMTSRIQHAVYASLSRSHGSLAFPYSTRLFRGYEAALRAPPRSRPPSRGTSPSASRGPSRDVSPAVSPGSSPTGHAFPRKLSLSSLHMRSIESARRSPSLDFSGMNFSHSPSVIRCKRSGSFRQPSIDSLTFSETSSTSGRSNDEIELVHTDAPGKIEDDHGNVTDLVFMVHGIGQAAVAQFEGVNWVYSVNLFRQHARKQSATHGLSQLMRNNRVQFLPVQWRARFAKLKDELQKQEEAEFERNTYTLSEIMLKDHVVFARDLLNNVILDLAYYMSRNRELMTRAICIEANAVYRKWCARHPGFDKRGRVHIIAHSLGCSIVTHVMSDQPTFVPPLSTRPVSQLYPTNQLLFNTSALFLCGSPAAMTMMLDQAPVIARKGRERSKYPRPDESLDAVGQLGCMAVDSVYNVFYPADVIAYRLNPAVDVNYATELPPSAIANINASVMGRISKALLSLPTLPMRLRKLSFGSLGGGGQSPLRAESLDTKMERERELERTRGKRRFAALNPHGTLDFYLQTEGINEYIDMITAHVVYWNDAALAAFVLGEIFADQDEKDKHV